MNIHETSLLPDVQAQQDERNIALNAVGIRGLRYPLTIMSEESAHSTVTTYDMTIALPAEVKGTHMSRFVELLEARATALDQAGFEGLVREMLNRLNSSTGQITLEFPYFKRKSAPITGAESWFDCDVTWRGEIADGGRYRFELKVRVPVTSLCPCSKEIAAYGAHNQRSHITVQVEPLGELGISEVIDIAEQSASSELFGLLKRTDEKYVTERAYENPCFVEDLVRNIAVRLETDVQTASYRVEAESLESIHNHSAVALIRGPVR